MKERNWLVSYASLGGLEMILFQMDYRTKHRANMQEAIVEVELFYAEFEEEFTLFFEELRNHCKEKLADL
jgi:acyl carrier protein phosphodiesterase